MQLNFEKFEFQIKCINNKNRIYDVIRKKFIVLTSEEWVRQHVIHQLLKNGFSAGLFSVEKKLPSSSKRYDVVVYNSAGKPNLLVECKSPKVDLDESILNQVSAYLQFADVPYVLLTNGLKHYLIERSKEGIKVSESFPRYQNLNSEG